MKKILLGQIGDVTFQFQPITSVSAEVRYSNPKIHGRETDLMFFSGGSGRTQELKIFLDNGYAQDYTFTETAIEQLETYRYKGDSGSPPAVMLSLGNDIYWVVIKRIDIATSIRDSSGNRTQAEVVLSIAEYVDEEHHRTNREQKGRRFVFISQDAQTFRKLAFTEYGNADLWKAIADRNPNTLIRMLGPIIPPGERIEIPEWSFAKTYLDTPQVGLVAYD